MFATRSTINLKRLVPFALAFSLFASHPLFGAGEHSCWAPSADHVNTWSNLLAAVQSAEIYEKAASTAYDNAKEAWDALSEKRAGLERLVQAFEALDNDYRQLSSRVSPTLLENNPEQVRAVVSAIAAITGRVDVLSRDYARLVETDGGWDGNKRAGDKEVRTFDENALLFDNKLADARRLRGHGIKWDCVRNLYAENFEPLKTHMESMKENLARNREEAERVSREAERAQSRVASFQQSVASFPAQIASNLRQPGISTASSLLGFLEDRAHPRVTVRFRSRGELVPDGSVSLKKGIEPLSKVLDPERTGFVFLGWRERNSREDFTSWGKPVERDLDLDAVWGYEVKVSGIDEPFRVPAENDLRPSLSAVLLHRKFTEFAKSLPPPRGKQLAGWRDSESRAPVENTTPISRSMVLEPIWEDVVHKITWLDPDGNFLDETPFKLTEAAKARPFPEDQTGHYLRWSTEQNGEKWAGFGKPLESDVTLYAVRDADYNVRFVLSNGRELPSRGFHNGDVFSPALAPEPPEQAGLVFLGWFDEKGEDFAGKQVSENLVLRAQYRTETFDEFVARTFRPLEARYPLPLLAIADVALIVVLILLWPSRSKKPRRSGHDHGHDHDEGGSGESGSDEGSATGEASAAKALATVLVALVPALASAAEAGAPAANPSVYVYPALVFLFVILAVVDLMFLFSRIGRAIASVKPRHGAAVADTATYVPPEKEVCPTCGKDLADGECPDGHTIVRCSKCQSIMKDGVCPRCGVGGEQEFCPTCNSELVDGECPRGHTIVRCPDCGSILQEGVCPRGCNADPLNLGWPGGAERKLGPFALQVVTCIKSEGEGFQLRVPDSFVVGRSSTDAKEPFVELLTITRKEKAQCSRQYVRLVRDGDALSFTVTLLNSSRNPAFVDGKKIVMQNDTATLPLGGRIKLNPGYELELVQAPEG